MRGGPRTFNIKLDPILLEVVINRLHEIGSTMEHVLFHSGYSSMLRESQDGSTGICDAKGEAVITAGTPIHLYPYHKSTAAVLENYKFEDMCEGDSFILTDPYEAGTWSHPMLDTNHPFR